jgi:hypothetical protein
MKYALLTGFFPQLNNFGDYIQTIAFEYLYEAMGIPGDDIVHIGLHELSDYDGEELLLPWNYAPFVLPTDQNGKLAFSKKIIPVFLGFSLAYFDWERKFVSIGHFMHECGGLEFLSTHQPIGCRDAYTRDVLAQYGIESYLQGCITNILPNREPTKDAVWSKVFLIDCNIELLKHMPKALLDHAEAMPNEFFANQYTQEEAYAEAKRHYFRLRDSAALVVSGRFHIVTPCYAMGIPSIFIERFMRFDEHVLINPGIPKYAYEDFNRIDWYPKVGDFSNFKEKLIQLAASRMKAVHALHEIVLEVDQFYYLRILRQEPQPPREWDKLRIQAFVDKHHLEAPARFHVWGAKPDLCRFGRALPVEYVKEINPRAEFLGWIDTFQTGSLVGYPIRKPDSLQNEPDMFVIVCADKAVDDAKQKFLELGMNDSQYCFCTYIRNIEPRDLNKPQ